MELLMGRYYKYEGRIFRASLCTFCNTRCVEKYHECLFKGAGSFKARKKDGTFLENIYYCIARRHPEIYPIQEVTESDYLLQLAEDNL